MDDLSLDSRNWKEFFLEDIVSINGGKRLTKADMQLGNMPFIGASELNNGITAFTCSINESIDNNVLGVNYNGSVGFAFYHPYRAIFSDDVKRIKWKSSLHNNRYTLLFLASMIGQQKCKYAYGYKFNSQRMKRQKILLPIQSNNTIDWGFMEAYMKQKERQILKPTIERLCKRRIISDISGGVNRCVPIGKPFTLPKFLPRFNVVNALKKPTTSKAILPMHHQHPSITVLTDLLEMMAA